MVSVKKAIGSTMLVAGTMIGAGMLAFPLKTLDMGFAKTAYLLVGTWFFMLVSALIGLKVSTIFPAGSSFYTMAKQTLGPWGRSIIFLSVVGLPYTLIAAYTSGATSFLKEVFPNTQESFLSIGFILILGTLCVFKTAIIDHTNRWLFLGKIAVFALVSYLALQIVQPGTLQIATQNVSLKFWTLIPVFIATFGFHGSLPGVVSYMGKDNARAIQHVFFWGMTIPLVVYIIWLVIIFGTIGHIDKSALLITLPEVLDHMGQATASPWLPNALDIFAQLALLTSFLGVALGLIHFIKDILKETPYNKPIYRGFATFIPPLAVVLIAPQIFVEAIAFAAIALLILSTLFPIYIALKFNGERLYFKKWQIFFLYIWFILGVVFIVIEFLNVFNFWNFY